MCTSNKTRLLRVVKQLDKKAADFCLWHVHHFVIFHEYILPLLFFAVVLK